MEDQLLDKVLTRAGLTAMEAPHDQIRMESNQDWKHDLHLLQAAEDGHD